MEPDSVISDSDIIRGCLKGDKASWDAFVGRFSNLVWWAVHRSLEKRGLTADRELGHDLFQSVFEKLIDKNELSKLREADSIKKFIVVLATHLSADRIKALSRLKNREISIESAELDIAAEDSNGGEEQSYWLVSEIVDRLSEKEKICLKLCYLNNKTHQEIADYLGMSLSTISSIIRRTKEKVRKKFESQQKK